MAGGSRPKRKRPGGFAAWLLDGNPLGRRLVFRGARKQVLQQTKGNYPAPLAALEAVAYGLAHGLAQGLKREAQLFGQLAVTDVSRSEEHTSELQSQSNLVCRLLLEKKKKKQLINKI